MVKIKDNDSYSDFNAVLNPNNYEVVLFINLSNINAGLININAG
jgi:hypothetical protein